MHYSERKGVFRATVGLAYVPAARQVIFKRLPNTQIRNVIPETTKHFSYEKKKNPEGTISRITGTFQRITVSSAVSDQ